jgi:hypothetical protein
MGRVAFAFGTPDRSAGVMDGSLGELLCTGDGPGGDSSLGSVGIGPILPEPAECSQEAASRAAPELKRIWLELSELDRQRFGHRFSFMVLKALGLRPCAPQEVES